LFPKILPSWARSTPVAFVVWFKYIFCIWFEDNLFAQSGDGRHDTPFRHIYRVDINYMPKLLKKWMQEVDYNEFVFWSLGWPTKKKIYHSHQLWDFYNDEPKNKFCVVIDINIYKYIYKNILIYQ
jgi:hypothetical protein